MLIRQEYSAFYNEYNSLLYECEFEYERCGTNDSTYKYIKIVWFMENAPYTNPEFLYAKINTQTNTVKIHFDDDQGYNDFIDEFSPIFKDYLLSVNYNDFTPRYIDCIEEFLVMGNSQITTVIDEDKIMRSYYFENLKNNYPLNVDGSCGYIALSILLSYYDILFSGDIVYDEISGYPMITSSNTLSTNLIYCTNSPGPSETFHNMIRLDVGGLANIYIYDPETATYDESLSIQEMKIILDTFMRDFSDYTMAGNSYSSIILNNINEIVNEIDQGRPVVIGMTDYVYDSQYSYANTLLNIVKVRTKAPHALVAYGYEIDNSGEIFLLCHSGWKAPSNIDVSNIRVKLLKDNVVGLSLRLGNYEHVCSNSYTINGISFCPCINENNNVPNVLNLSNNQNIALLIQFENEFFQTIKRREEDEK